MPPAMDAVPPPIPPGVSPDPDGPDAVELERDRRVAQATLVVLMLPTIWFARTDLEVAAHSLALLNERVLVRLVFLGVLTWGIVRLRSIRSRPDYARTVLIVGLLTAVCIVLLNLMRPYGSTLPLRTPLMWLLAYYAGLANRPALQLIPPLVISLSLILLRLFWVNSGASGTIDGDILVVVAMNLVGSLLVWNRHQAQRRLKEAWAAERQARTSLERTLSELRQLRGIIPICAHCKEVRTEVGDWLALDAYVRAHSEAEFSHGICPNCLSKHYSDA